MLCTKITGEIETSVRWLFSSKDLLLQTLGLYCDGCRDEKNSPNDDETVANIWTANAKRFSAPDLM